MAGLRQPQAAESAAPRSLALAYPLLSWKSLLQQHIAELCGCCGSSVVGCVPGKAVEVGLVVSKHLVLEPSEVYGS